MTNLFTKFGLSVFSTCPQSKDHTADSYARRVAEIAQWSERYGCRGILVYADNGLADPWLVSDIIINHTEQLCPLVAVQPIYMHPYTVAKMVASYGYLHNRRIYLNMIAGGFKNDLLSLCDDTPHDDRYKRLTEYTQIIQRLLEGGQPLSFEGAYYRTAELKLTPSLPSELMPGILVSGSSDAGLEAAHNLGAVPIKYPHRSDEEAVQEPHHGVEAGVRVGIIARETTEEAWEIANERFPEDRKGQVTHHLAMKVSDSQWHKQLSQATDESATLHPYWLGPFKNYKTFCPYLVGSYETVAAEVAAYIDRGYRTFILDIPPCEEELWHTSIVFQEALEKATTCRS